MEQVDAVEKSNLVSCILVHCSCSSNFGYVFAFKSIFSRPQRDTVKKSKKKKAYILYNERFTKGALQQIYEEKISSSRTVGRDGTRQETFKANLDDEINLILKKVGACTYRFTAYKQKLISKGAHKPPRVLSIPTIRARLTLRVLNEIISHVFSEAQIWRPTSTSRTSESFSRSRATTWPL